MKTRLVRCATAIAAAAAIAGCAETAQDEADSFGSLATAVTATGTDGATYRLPAGTYVQAYNDIFYDYWSMDGDNSILSVEVPVGNYYVALGHANGYTVEWPLERENPDATTETVNATLLTAQPVSVVVTENATTSLVFQFLVVDGGTVTFAHGIIDISVDVTVDESTIGRAMFSGTYVKSYESFGTTAPPDLNTHVPAMGANVFHQIIVNVVGDWHQTSTTTACSTATLNSGVVSASIYDVTREAWLAGAGTTPTATLCVYAGANPYLYVTSSRSGAALTPAFQGYGDYQFYFQQSMSTNLPDEVFDGDTLDLGAMTGTFELPAYLSSNIYAFPTGGTVWENWYNDGNSGADITFQFTPTL